MSVTVKGAIDEALRGPGGGGGGGGGGAVREGKREAC